MQVTTPTKELANPGSVLKVESADRAGSPSVSFSPAAMSRWGTVKANLPQRTASSSGTAAVRAPAALATTSPEAAPLPAGLVGRRRPPVLELAEDDPDTAGHGAAVINRCPYLPFHRPSLPFLCPSTAVP